MAGWLQAEKVYNHALYFKKAVEYVGEPMSHIESICSSAVSGPTRCLLPPLSLSLAPPPPHLPLPPFIRYPSLPLPLTFLSPPLPHPMFH